MTGVEDVEGVVSAPALNDGFRVPARVDGVYDVSVCARVGRSTVLSNALRYVAAVGTTTPEDDGTGTAAVRPLHDRLLAEECRHPTATVAVAASSQLLAEIFVE